MNLSIDIGNSRTKYGVFEGRKLIHTGIHDGMPDEAMKDLLSRFNIRHLALATVGQTASEAIHLLWPDADKLFISHLTPLPITTRYDTPSTLGVDRICAAVAAHMRFPHRNVLVIDAGTCITYDLVSDKGIHYGGGISPGLKMRLEAMHHFTHRLPLINAKIMTDMGTNTETSMQFGAYRGMLGEMKEMITYFSTESQDLQVILSGGDLNLFEQQFENTIFAAQNLVLEGINEILLHNRKLK